MTSDMQDLLRELTRLFHRSGLVVSWLTLMGVVLLTVWRLT